MPLTGARATASRGYFGGGTKPGAPIITSSTQGVSSLSIAFTPPVFNGGLLISKYEYAVSINNSTWTTFATAVSGTNPPTSPVTISGLTNGQPYYVKIRAVNGLGFGPDSNVWSTTTTPRTTPDAPTITSLTRGYRRLTVAFTAPAFHGGSAITDYEYSINGGTTFASMVQATTADYPITGLADFTSYDVRVRAMNVAPGGGTRSNLVSAYTAGVPGTVTGVSGTSNADATSSVSWTAPDANGDGIDDYTIEYSTTSDFSSSVTTFSHTASAAVSQPIPLTNGTTYYFRVKAVNAVGSSVSWSAISGAARPAIIAGIPTSITQSSGDGSYTIGWTAPSGTAPFKYVVQLTTDNETDWSTSTANPIRLVWDATGTSYTFTQLTNSYHYRARVYAYNDAGATAPYWAESAAETPSKAPAIPTGLIGSAGDTTYTLEWTAVPATGATVTYYVQLTNADQAGWNASNIQTTTGTSYTFTGLTNGKVYRAQVKATNVRLDAASATYADNHPATVKTPSFGAPGFGTNGDYAEQSTINLRKVAWAIDPTDIVNGTTTVTKVYKQWTHDFGGNAVTSPVEEISSYTGTAFQYYEASSFAGSGTVVAGEQYRLQAVQYDGTHAVGSAYINITIKAPQPYQVQPASYWVETAYIQSTGWLLCNKAGGVTWTASESVPSYDVNTRIDSLDVDFVASSANYDAYSSVRSFALTWGGTNNGNGSWSTKNFNSANGTNPDLVNYAINSGYDRTSSSAFVMTASKAASFASPAQTSLFFRIRYTRRVWTTPAAYTAYY